MPSCVLDASLSSSSSVSLSSSGLSKVLLIPNPPYNNIAHYKINDNINF